MTLETVWARLASVRGFTFIASSSASTGWSGTGTGTVDVSQPALNELVYTESGTWTPIGGKQLSFANVYRWTRQADANTIRLDHLRFGSDNPVFLFDLGITDDTRMASVDPHV